uniref:ANK_REP_REGION domain-containing protein n=1 Tax=Panagrellus redivivus TaxID=6233 RepID=A0A7E4VHY0_PANRE
MHCDSINEVGSRKKGGRRSLSVSWLSLIIEKFRKCLEAQAVNRQMTRASAVARHRYICNPSSATPCLKAMPITAQKRRPTLSLSVKAMQQEGQVEMPSSMFVVHGTNPHRPGFPAPARLSTPQPSTAIHKRPTINRIIQSLEGTCIVEATIPESKTPSESHAASPRAMSTTTRDSSVDTADKYTFGYTTELSNQETALSTAKRLRQRLQRQQSGQSVRIPGRRYTGESSECSSLVGTPTESGRCFTFSAAQRVLRNEERKPSVNQNLSEMILDAIHLDDANLVERILIAHSSKPLSTSPSIGSTNTFTDLAQRRHGNHRRSNASSTMSTHSGGRSSCAIANILHLAIAHKQKDIVEVLLKTGYDANAIATCSCKGNCTASGNIPLSSILPRPHTGSPELCSTCSNLRVVSIVDTTPLGVAVKAQSPEMIALLVAYGADVNATDEDGNAPLMVAVRESPLSWPCLHALIIFGGQINQKNLRGICPIDLAPELRKVQETCIESLFQIATTLPDPNAGEQPERPPRYLGAAAVRHQRRLHVTDYEKFSIHSSIADRGSLSKAPLSPRPSAAPSVSTCSMLETMSAKEPNRRKSFVSLQLHRRTKSSKEASIMEQLTWEQAWEMLRKVAANHECTQALMANLVKFCQKEVGANVAEADQVDSHLGGLMHQMLLTMLNQYTQSTPSYQKSNRRQLIGSLAQLVNFCVGLLQRSGTNRQFSALGTINKVGFTLIDILIC